MTQRNVLNGGYHAVVAAKHFALPCRVKARPFTLPYVYRAMPGDVGSQLLFAIGRACIERLGINAQRMDAQTSGTVWPMP